MYRFERTIAFLIDGSITVAIYILLYESLLHLSWVFNVGLLYNLLWIYYLATGLCFGGSLGKRIFKIKIRNRKNELRLMDLVRRYSFLIALGVFYTVAAPFVVDYRETFGLSFANAFMNSYIPVVLLYLVSTNIGHEDSLYDHLSKLKLTKDWQNQSVQTTSASARV
ncbi:RDD family protein [Pelagicoccus sp. SDUM812002]|uniref:RDD family protein n=1 Tax=Pelagicoccus sp. SDUM812002 TaxID=3041266 RepID=UPI00281040FF|nr:RDD family protein [Pelagicoccus sp. SDUM812002]MDQ8188535.1 RDD family protein [Pelagicoccus sp. SDUM812002]